MQGEYVTVITIGNKSHIILHRSVNLPEGPGSHSVLWNAMIYPFLNMTIKGAVWYQGEANAGMK